MPKTLEAEAPEERRGHVAGKEPVPETRDASLEKPQRRLLSDRAVENLIILFASATIVGIGIFVLVTELTR